MSRDRAARTRLDEAAAALTASSRAYTAKNLFHRWRHLGGREVRDVTFEAFVEGPLATRLARAPLAGLLPPATRWDGPRLPREWEAYFPKAILVVDRPAILDLFVASGVITTARLAVVCVDGSPSSVVDWLARGFQRGHRAPVGYLHDASTAFYPFAVEPLASLVDASRGAPIDYHDLGLPARGAIARRFPLADLPKGARLRELEALPPCALVAYAARRLIAKVPGDPRMAPLIRPPRTPKTLPRENRETRP